MSKLVWDQTGQRYYETGTDHGVVYPQSGNGSYQIGYAWNGLTAVTESPSGAEPTDLYADNIKYLSIRSAEEFGATIEAYSYPDEFAVLDGSAQPVTGVYIGQQTRKAFGFCYRSRLGNDIQFEDFGYKLHLVYGCTVSPSERAYQTINDSPEAITFSWELTTTPVYVEGYKPTSIITIDSSKFVTDNEKEMLAYLEEELYGTDDSDPRLPLPAEVFQILSGGLGTVTYHATGGIMSVTETTDSNGGTIVDISWTDNGSDTGEMTVTEYPDRKGGVRVEISGTTE